MHKVYIPLNYMVYMIFTNFSNYIGNFDVSLVWVNLNCTVLFPKE